MAAASECPEGVSVPHVVWQCFLMTTVFYLWSSPIIQPVKVMVVLFHEMSHGLTAIATGGKVLNILITPDEGGSCETEGGIPALIVSAGYLGSMFFGGLLLYLSRFRGCLPVVYTFLTLTVSTAIFTVLHEPYPRTFATGLAATFIFLGLLAPPFLGSFFLRVLGTVSCLYSIFDIYWDVLATRPAGEPIENDAVAFASITGVDPQLVGGLWLVLSVIYFIAIVKIIVRQGAPAVAVEGKAAPA